ncbi:glycosyltransferase family 2 protein [Tenuifilum thalassicum]|uniref:Glycosyltransferase family 2 protein n=1 Tax=Tenuifilum thalassicum TaxID=2590900 RepID=A0A7D4AWP2_9BACT|nr:glycosyltransferase family 2 protein [Tenuifilum thalassicum]QKG79634.1 glycosyltransferase family 2 protein [Tenuifilum thalassicum]
MKAKVSVVILNWNGKHFLEKFLPTLIENTNIPNTEIVVADNGSTDGSKDTLEGFKSVKKIYLDKNYGFTGGYNRALSKIESEYYVLLNSDIETPKGWLEPMIEFMDATTEVAACAPKLLDYHRKQYFEYAGAAGGFIDLFGYPFCRGRILSEVEKDHGQYDTPMPIFWASGACMMIRSELFHAVGGFDQDFFAHMEEIDLCWRLQNHGYKIFSVPQSYVYHVGGGTLPNNTPFKLYLNYRNNLWMLHKNLSLRALLVVIPIRLVLDWLSALVYLFTGKFSFFKSVLKAHHHYFSKISTLNTKRKSEKRLYSAIRYKGLILVDFFIQHRRKFSKINFY